MTNTMKALYGFFGSFGIPAYAENDVPDTVPDGAADKVKPTPPYITVQLVSPNWRAAVPIFARVWYRSDGYEAINAKVDAIADAIGEGVGIPTPTGAVYLYKGDTFAQYQDMAGDPTLKCAYLSMTMQAITT